MWAYFLTFCAGFACCWIFDGLSETDEREHASLSRHIIVTLEGYLHTKPLLNETERALLQKVSALHDLD